MIKRNNQLGVFLFTGEKKQEHLIAVAEQLLLPGRISKQQNNFQVPGIILAHSIQGITKEFRTETITGELIDKDGKVLVHLVIALKDDIYHAFSDFVEIPLLFIDGNGRIQPFFNFDLQKRVSFKEWEQEQHRVLFGLVDLVEFFGKTTIKKLLKLNLSEVIV